VLVRFWRRQRPAYGAVRVVWDECKTAYPEIVLPPHSRQIRANVGQRPAGRKIDYLCDV